MTILRSAVFNACFYLVTFVLVLAATVARIGGLPAVLAVGALWARCLLALARWICGIRLSVEGLERIPQGAVLLACRHQSAFDTFVWLHLLPRCCYVLKRELLHIPLFSGLIRSAGMIPIDRKAGGAAIRTLIRDGQAAARDGRQIVIFPEGSRSEYGHPLPMQPGIAALAARTGLTVIPVATNSGLCWGRRAFRKRPGLIRIVVGDPVAGSTERTALLQHVSHGMSACDPQSDREPLPCRAVGGEPSASLSGDAVGLSQKSASGH